MTRKFTGGELVVATHNKKKIEELRAMFGDRVENLLLAGDLGLDSPAETGTTYVENASLKALYTAKETGKISLADDSGLSVDALDGAPGVYSADWAENPDGTRDFSMAMEKVHKAMGGNPDRRARFTACFVLAWPDGHIETVEGHVQGTLVWPPRGTGGMGYDPMFQPAHDTRTFGEIPAEEKNRMSHRAEAFRLMMEKCFS